MDAAWPFRPRCYPGKVEEEVLGRAYDARLMRRLFSYLRPYRLAVGSSLVLLLLLSVLQVAGPLLTKIAVDRYLVPTQGRTVLDPWLSPNPWRGLAQISALYMLALISMFVLDFAQTYLMQWTGQRAMFDLRRDLMARLQRLDLSFYDRTPVGRMLTRVTTDVDALNELLASGLVTILGDVLMLSFVFVVMLKLDAPLTAVLAAVLPAVVAVTVLFRRQATQSYRRIRVAIARINAYLQEHLTGMAVLQLFNREGRSVQEFDQINRAHMEAFKDAIIAYGWFFPAVEFLSMLALAPGARLRRLPHPPRRHDDRRAGGVLSVRHAAFPAHPGPEREVQHPAIGHGGGRAHSSDCSILRLRSPPRRFAGPFPPARSRSSLTASGSPTRTTTGCCAT